jgi:hypothetical protein
MKRLWLTLSLALVAACGLVPHIGPPATLPPFSCPQCVEVPIQAPALPAPTANLRGQFVIDCPGCPYGPRPGADDNVVFLAELDTIWRDTPDLAERIVQRYLAMGANAIVANTAVAGGYHRDYPAHDWRGRAEQFADYLTWLHAHGLSISLWVLPDIEPYYDASCPCFDWDAVDRDLTPIYAQPRVQAAVSRVVYMWEDYQRSTEMARGYDYLRRVFPTQKRYWHNPPGHASPGLSDEDEQGSWRLAAAHGLDGIYYQAWPPSQNPVPGNAVGAPIEQLRYDLWDLARRFFGRDGSPWGSAVTKADGSPLETVWAEGTAYAIYNHRYPTTVGQSWCAAALAVDGVADCLDGLPIQP